MNKAANIMITTRIAFRLLKTKSSSVPRRSKAAARCATLCAGQAQNDEIQDRQYRHKENDPVRIGLHKCYTAINVGDQVRLHLVSFRADPGQDAAPKRRANDRRETESPKIHPHESSWIGNQVPNNRQQSGKENAAGFVTFQPDFRALQFVMRDEEIYAEAVKQRTPDEEADPVTYRRAKIRSDCPRKNDAGHAEIPASRQKRCRPNHDLAWNRDDRTFHSHESDDAPIPAV